MFMISESYDGLVIVRTHGCLPDLGIIKNYNSMIDLVRGHTELSTFSIPNKIRSSK